MLFIPRIVRIWVGLQKVLQRVFRTISSNVGGFPDIVIDGETGYTVKPKSERELANAMIKMIENPKLAAKMTEKGKKLVTKMLDIENTGESIMNVYNKIICGGKM